MRAWKILVVICGSVLLTTVVIEASDTLYGSGGSLMARLISYEEPVCPMGMTHMPAALTFTCVDTFEASAGPSCVTADPANQFDTELNLARKECLPVAEEYNVPWRYITREQAAIACVRAGKRLPTAGEWYQFSLGTTPKVVILIHWMLVQVICIQHVCQLRVCFKQLVMYGSGYRMMLLKVDIMIEISLNLALYNKLIKMASQLLLMKPWIKLVVIYG
jgi:hypothetical protein